MSETRYSLDRDRSAALARNWWAILLRGTVAVLFGLLAFVSPEVTRGTLVILFGIYAFIDGAFATIAAASAVVRQERWGLLLLEGIIGLVAGAASIMVPVVAITVWIYLIALWATVTGVLLVASAFRLQPDHGNWLLGLGGFISIVWGVLLATFPVTGAVVLTIWLGGYALIFGIAMVLFAWQLRARHVDRMMRY